MKKRISLFAAVAVVAGLLAAFLVSPSSAAGETRLVAQLSGEGETSGGDPDGLGRANIKLIPSKGLVCFRVSWRKIGGPIASHIHEAPAGQDGDVVVPLFEGSAPLPKTIKAVSGCVGGVSKQLMARIKQNPENFYVNVHNKGFPAGAIRGQLATEGG